MKIVQRLYLPSQVDQEIETVCVSWMITQNNDILTIPIVDICREENMNKYTQIVVVISKKDSS